MPKNAETAAQSFNKTDADHAGTKQLIATVGDALLEKQALDITVLDVRELTSLTDAFVVCHAESDVQVKALADNVAKQTREQIDEKPWQKEGLQKRRWVILDYVNVVVHIFQKEVRDYYDLERIWGDADITKIEEDPS